jgi:5-formyltetrahydrofolate cyclo-ligase
MIRIGLRQAKSNAAEVACGRFFAAADNVCMAHNEIDDVRRLKRQMRAEASARRARQADAELLSRRIFQHIAALPEYARAHTVMLYLDVGSEVCTRWFVPTVWASGKQIVVPYCEEAELGLFRLDSFDELAPGAMGILEPTPEWRRRADRNVAPTDLDLIVAPGVAFDRLGARLGYGKGYYDKLLQKIRGDATKAAVCFECQLLAEIPALPHDVRMDMVVTEKAVYRVVAKGD